MDGSRRLARGLVLLLVVALLTPAATAAVDRNSGSAVEPHAGVVQDPANGSTVVSIQGFHFDDQGSKKKPARLLAAGERADTKWIYNGTDVGATWFYDVDPLPNGNLLVVSTKKAHTLVYELNPETRERVWSQELDTDDTHDVDLLPNGNLLVADMRNWENGRSEDRIFVFDRETDEVVWEWQFRNHFPNATDGGMSKDWTHVNDVDRIDEHRLLLSPRNFDQVLILNRTTGEIEKRLGADGRHDVLYEQHNPDYLESENGTGTILVADSENDRVVEYAYDGDGEWTRTWEVGSSESLSWPRDADRLPNGNTLITDTMNHRVIEVTPTGEVVWEYYAPWSPYDAERTVHGDGSSGPTIRDLNATGTYAITGGSDGPTAAGAGVPGFVRATFGGTPLAGPADELARSWSHVVPWIKPVWMSGWEFALAVLGGLVAVGWLLTEAGLRLRSTVRRRRAA
jgi:hypothetical protein